MRIVLFVLILFSLAGCNKDLVQVGPDAKVEFFLLENYEVLEGYSCAINESQLALAPAPLIKYQDIIWYDRSDYTFKFSASAANLLHDENQNTLHGQAFAVVADGKMVYTGYFWAAYSSLSCEWLTIDPLNYGDKNEFKARLAYPGPSFASGIPDRRNDERIIQIFKRDNKLKN